jgi:hypothetical protein
VNEDKENQQAVTNTGGYVETTTQSQQLLLHSDTGDKVAS